jgi:O-antigen ligase
VLGLGPANFPTAEGTLSDISQRQQYGVGVRWNAAHNSYIQVGAETGFPGLVIYLAMIATTFGALRVVTRGARGPDHRRIRELASALTAAVIGFVVGAFFLSLAYQEMFFTLLALVVGLHKVARLDAADARRQVIK